MRHGSIITLPPVKDLPRHGNTLIIRDKEVYSDAICWLSVGQSLLGIVWCEYGRTVNDDSYCAALKTLRNMAWFSSTTMPGRTRPSRLGTCCKISVGKRCTVSRTVRIWHQRIFTIFLPWWSLTRPSFHPRWIRQTRNNHGAELTGIYFLPARDGQTYHTLWQMPHTSSGLKNEK